VSDTAKIAGKSQADLAIGALTVPRTSPDYYPLEMGNLILGRLGLMGRLGANVRDKQGLAYYAYSAIESGRQASLWAARAGVDPANIDRAHAGVIAELRRLREEPVTEDELADGKSYLTGSLPIALETNDGVAATLLAIEYYDLGLDYLDRYPDIINAITREEVLAATRNHLDPDRLAVGIALPD
jgi:zinc protease